MRYKLLKDWESKRHGKTICCGTYVVITIKSELEDLINGDYIKAPKKKNKKTKKIKDNGRVNDTADN